MRSLLAGPRRGEAEPGLRAGRLRATFDSERGLLGTSLTLDGDELLGPLGIPFLHPWANRLTDPLEGADVPRDERGLPIHGTHAAAWTVEAHSEAALFATLEFSASDVFPYAHRATHLVRLTPEALRVDTTIRPTSSDPVPIAFGFHPYFRIERESMIGLPARSRLVADERLIPTGERVAEPAEIAPLGGRTFDDGYALDGPARFSVGGRLSVAFLFGYPFAQVYAPPAGNVICFEPMTAPTNALVTGSDLRRVAPGHVFRAAFEIRVG